MVQRAGFHGTLGQSSAQVIDGSLRVSDGSSGQTLSRTATSGNRRTWTWSAWLKREQLADKQTFMFAETDDSNQTSFGFNHSGATPKSGFYFRTEISGTTVNATLHASLRDCSSWYHVVVACDTTQSEADDRVKVYINGTLQTWSTSPGMGQNADLQINHNVQQQLFAQDGVADLDAKVTQVYLLDGTAVGPGEFGFTDPLTNTWRPKKYTGSAWGTNGFYLPLDGNSPIGKDMSGEGHDWTPKRFGSAALDKATGAFPIRNTTNGGKIAAVGTRDDANASNLVFALPFNDRAHDVHHLVKGSGSAKSITTNGNPSPSFTKSNFYGGSFEFDGTGDYLETANNTDFQFGTGDWTIEFWWNGSASGSYTAIITTLVSSDEAGTWRIGTRFNSTNKLYFSRGTGSGFTDVQIGVDVNDSEWHHIAFVRSSGTLIPFVDGVDRTAALESGSLSDSNTMTTTNAVKIGYNQRDDAYITGCLSDLRVYKGVAKYTENFIPASTNPFIVPDTPSGVSLSSTLAKITNGSVNFDGTGDYLQIPNHADLRFGSDAFCVEAFVYYSETSGNGTIAGLWNSGSNRRSWLFQIESDNRRLRGFFSANGSTVTQVNGSTGQMTRNAWHHVAFTRSGNDFRIFLDGVEVGSATSSDSLLDNSDDDIGIGSAQGGASSDPITGFISDVRIVKGSAVYTSDFTPPAAPLTNITNTKLLCCQSTVSATAADVIPTGSITANGNAVVTTFSPFNTDISTVRGQESNYATLNPNNRRVNAVLTNNNLTWTCDNSDSGTVLATAVVNSGKYYWEVTVDNAHRFHAGVHAGPGAQLATNDAGITAFDWAFRSDGAKVHAGAESSTNFSNVSGIGNVIQLAYDGDGGNLWFGANGHWFEGNPSALSGPSYTGVTSTGGISPMLNRRTNDNGASINFGQKPFKYAPPKGFQTLNSANIRSEIEVRPDQYVGIVTYRGTGATQSITGVGFHPDLVWTKQADGTNTHALYDVVRTPPNVLYTSEQNSEESNAGYLTQIDPDGFTVGSADLSNVNNGSFVAWCWKAGGNKNTFSIDDFGYATAAAAGLNGGTITPTGASVGTEQGFSIISYTGNATNGATFSHGLSSTPKMYIIKDRDSDSNWFIFNSNLPTNQNVYFNAQDAGFAAGGFAGASATSSLIQLPTGGSNTVNESNKKYICYAWHDVPGLQKFGMYTGDGTTDGPYIDCGFRPALLWVKNTSSGSTDWVLLDTTTGSDINPMFRRFAINQQTAQVSDSTTTAKFDFYSNGFKSVGGDGTFVNTSGENYIYCAFAETPTNNLYGAQANAK